MAWIDVNVNIDIEDYLDEVSTKDLMKELENRKNSRLSVKDDKLINSSKQKLEEIRLLLRLRKITDIEDKIKEQIIEAIKEL